MRTVSKIVIAAALTAASALTSSAKAQNDWPITPNDWKSPLYNGYGQYQERAGGLHFHEGVDIEVKAGDEMKAPAWMKDYFVRAIKSDGYNSYLVLAQNKAGAYGQTFNLVHLEPHKDLKVGDKIAAGTTLGKVRKGTGHPAHLHFDWANNESAWTKIGKPVDDLLAHVTPAKGNEDTHKPSVGAVRFRVAAHDRLGTHTKNTHGMMDETERDDNDYFFLKVPGGPGKDAAIVGARAATRSIKAGKEDHDGSADFDIVASAWDQWHKDGRYIGVRKIGFQAKGVTAAGDTGAVNTVDFRGQFLGAGQDYDDFRNHELVRALFSNDKRANSNDGSGDNKDLVHCFTVTNADGTGVVKKANMDLYWNSNVRKGEGRKWNTPSSEANDAAKNAHALFPDDFYDVTITVEDYSGNKNTKVQRILLDNFIQTVELEKTSYAMGKPLIIESMLNFLPDAGVPLMLLTARPDRDLPLSLQGQILTYAPMDSEGELFNHTLSPLSEMGSYWLVADYDGDDYFTRRLDAFDRFNVVPGPATLALLGGTLLIPVRRRRLA